MPIQFFQEALSISEKTGMISTAFRKKFRPENGRLDDGSYTPWEDRPEIDNIYDDQNYLVARMSGDKFRVDYTMDGQHNITFDEKSQWKKIEYEVKVIESDGNESRSVLTAENNLHLDLIEEADGKMEADIVLIEPGFGNLRDKHYYSKDIIKKYAHLFEGAKMHATGHNEDSHGDVRNWVATVKEAGKRFASNGAALARIAIHNKDFWSQLKSLKEHGLLHKMANSILAVGLARKGLADGKEANIVESILKAKTVDFVGAAGAGGRVMQLIEDFKAGGDLDFITLEDIEEQRPDLIKQFRVKIAEEENPEIIVEEDMADKELEGRLKKLEEQNAELQKDNEILAKAVKEGRGGTLKQQAVNYLVTEYSENLPKVTLTRVKSQLEAGEFEEDTTDKEVKRIVDSMVEAEIEYFNNLKEEMGMKDEDAETMPKKKKKRKLNKTMEGDDEDDEEVSESNVRGLGVAFADEDIEWLEEMGLTEEPLAESADKVDAILRKYGANAVSFKEDK